ncbi:hypothetical protein, partial [Actinocatenispora thailandica]
MATRRVPGPDPHRGGRTEDDADDVVVPLRRDTGGLGDARRYRPRGRTVRESADPADASRRADQARRSQERQARARRESPGSGSGAGAGRAA